MIITQASEKIPLREDQDGVVRVGETRVTLDTIVSAFNLGATPEEIVQQYPTVSLSDVYYVVGYYLRRPAEVESYLQRRQKLATDLRGQNERRFDPTGVRERLISRQQNGSR
ncbi:DUF433 domain-containing protein [candidate division KSB1 bacterium]|nr:DUF433 domain-containing protein [candidate division KSB1 bacterium]